MMKRYQILFIYLLLITPSYLAAQQSSRERAIAITIQGLEAVSADSFAKGALLFSKAIAADSTYMEARLQRANAYFNLQEFPAAYDDYYHLISHDAASPEAYMRTGDIYNWAGKKDDGLRYYTEAIKRDAGQGSYYASRGGLLIDMQKYAEAIKDLERAIALKYNVPAMYGKLGFAWSRNNDNKKALEYFNKAIEQDKQNIDLYALRGFSLVETGLFAAAEEDYLQYLARNPNDLSAIYNLARARYGLGKYQEAARGYRKILDVQPDYYNTWFQLGMVYVAQEDYPMALTAFDEAIKQTPKEGYLYYNRAAAKFKSNKGDYCPDLEKAIKLGEKEAVKMQEKLCK